MPEVDAPVVGTPVASPAPEAPSSDAPTEPVAPAEDGEEIAETPGLDDSDGPGE